MRILWMPAASAALLALGACGEQTDETGNRLAAGEPVTNNMAEMVPVAANPVEYANLVSAIDLHEIEAARLALENSENADVRALAQTILTDHQSSNELLGSVAAQAQPPVTVTPQLNPEQQANLDRLRGMDGEDFDREYLVQQVAAHEKAYAMVNDYASRGEDAAMRQHASTVVGPIYQHLSRARELAEGIQQ